MGLGFFFFLTSIKKKESYSQKKNYKILMEAWRRVVSVHQCFNSVFFPIETRPWTLQTWLPPGNIMIWVQRLAGECLVDTTRPGRSKPVVLDLAMLNGLSDSCFAIDSACVFVASKINSPAFRSIPWAVLFGPFPSRASAFIIKV